MNFKNILLSSALVITSLSGGVAEARPTELTDMTTSDGTQAMIFPVGPNGVHVVATNDYTRSAFIGRIDCSTGGYEWEKNVGYTKTQMEDILIEACRF